jgi:hypothetical protein
MPRVNPNTFCTKWLDESNAMTDEEHAAADEIERDRKQLAWFCNVNPQYAAFLAKRRDTARAPSSGATRKRSRSSIHRPGRNRWQGCHDVVHV